MKFQIKVIFFFLSIIFNLKAYADLPLFTKDIREKIGPTMTPPIEYQNKLYFLSTPGVLYESDFALSKAQVLYKADHTSMSGLLLKMIIFILVMEFILIIKLISIFMT